MTKEKIVGRLLADGAITAEEAIVLLQGDTPVPQPSFQPVWQYISHIHTIDLNHISHGQTMGQH